MANKTQKMVNPNIKIPLSCLASVKRNRNSPSLRPQVPSSAFVSSCQDRSSSMETFGAALATSLFEFINDQKIKSDVNNVDVNFTLTLFDTAAETLYDNVKIKDINLRNFT